MVSVGDIATFGSPVPPSLSFLTTSPFFQSAVPIDRCQEVPYAKRSHTTYLCYCVIAQP
jgi:hypothetical protein